MLYIMALSIISTILYGTPESARVRLQPFREDHVNWAAGVGFGPACGLCAITGAAHARVMEHTRTRRIGPPAATFDFAKNDFALCLGKAGFAGKPNEQRTTRLLMCTPVLHWRGA
jgi:hypothetical protein